MTDPEGLTPRRRPLDETTAGPSVAGAAGDPGAAVGRAAAARDLRTEATRRAQKSGIDDVASMSHEDIAALLHELRVHQIELEMQNDELVVAQAALETSRSRYFDLYDLAPVGYITIDAAGRITEANLAAATMLGENRAQLVGRPFTRCILPEDQDLLYFHRRRSLDGSASEPCRLRLTRADGTTIWARLEERVTEDLATGGPVRRATLSDITASVAAADERMALLATLAEAQRLELVGRLAGGVAHDLNNMLTVILAGTEFALDGLGLSDPLRHDLEPVREATLRSAELTAQLIAYARQQVAAPRVVDLNEVVSAALKLIGHLVREGVEVTWRPAPRLRATLIDPAQVTRILTNLCVNSRDAIDGPGTITISTSDVDVAAGHAAGPHTAHPGSWVVLSVRDTGRGMTPDVIDHIFEPYYTSKDPATGGGLGLATVDGMVAQNHGFVTVSSRPGVGTTFSVHLPAVVATAGASVTVRPATGRSLPGD